MSRNPDPELLDKERQAVELRRAGATYEEIARAIGYATAQGAWLAYNRAMKRTLVEAGTEEIRQTESDRLDRLHRALWPKAISGDIKAITSILRLMERRARLLGLDAPTKIQAEVTNYEGGSDIDREVARLASLLANSEGSGIETLLDSQEGSS